MAAKKKYRFVVGCAGIDFKYAKGDVASFTAKEAKAFGALIEEVIPPKKRETTKAPI